MIYLRESTWRSGTLYTHLVEKDRGAVGWVFTSLAHQRGRTIVCTKATGHQDSGCTTRNGLLALSNLVILCCKWNLCTGFGGFERARNHSIQLCCRGSIFTTSSATGSYRGSSFECAVVHFCGGMWWEMEGGGLPLAAGVVIHILATLSHENLGVLKRDRHAGIVSPILFALPWMARR